MRARDIKPGFYKNEELAECGPWARLLYPGLWMLADREGRLECRYKRIKAEVFPFDNVDVPALVDELEAQGLVKRYEVGGLLYLFIPKFLLHQRPHVNEKASVIPPCTTVVSPDPADTLAENTCDHGEQRLQPWQKALRSSSLTSSSLTAELNINPENSLEEISGQRFSEFQDFGRDSPKPEFLDFARDFQETVLREHGKLAPRITESLVFNGAKTLEKGVRIDGFDLEEVKTALVWAITDSFWGQNVRSLAQMRGKMRNGITKLQGVLGAYRKSAPKEEDNSWMWRGAI